MGDEKTSKNGRWVSGTAATIGYVTAIITGIAVTINQAIDVRKFYYPQSSLKVLAFSITDGITIANTGENKVFISDLIYHYSPEPGWITQDGTVRIDQTIEAGSVLTYQFTDEVKGAINLMSQLDGGAAVLTDDYLQFIDRWNINGLDEIHSYYHEAYRFGDGLRGSGTDIKLCVRSELTFNDDGEYKLVSRNLGNRLHQEIWNVSLDAVDLGTGLTVSPDNIDGFHVNSGRMLFFVKHELCPGHELDVNTEVENDNSVAGNTKTE